MGCCREVFLRCEKQCGGAENTKLSDSVLLGFSWTCGEFSFAGVYTERECPACKKSFWALAVLFGLRGRVHMMSALELKGEGTQEDES